MKELNSKQLVSVSGGLSVEQIGQITNDALEKTREHPGLMEPWPGISVPKKWVDFIDFLRKIRESGVSIIQPC